MKFVDAVGNIKFGKAMFFGNNIQMSEQADGIVTINAGILSGTGTSLALLGDVVVTSIQDDQFLRYSTGSSKWINQFITAADVGAGTFKAGAFVFPNTLNVTGNETIGGNLIVSGTTTPLGVVNNLTASGTNTFIGTNKQQIGTSAVFAKWSSILFSDAAVHFYSGTAETSLSSYTLKGSSITANGQAIKIRGEIERASNGGSNFHIKLGNICVIVSGTLGSVQRTSFEGTLYRSSSNAVRTFWTVYSGVSDPQVGSSSIATSILGNVVGASAIDWTQDQLIDFRASNYVTDTSGISLNFWQISHEAV